MLEVLKFILNCVIQFISMLFRIDVGFTNLGVVMCICYILFPMLLVIVNFLKSSVIEELDDRYDYERRMNRKVGYIGKHEYTGRHSKRYFERQKEKERWSK